MEEDAEHELKDTEQEVVWKTKLEAKKKYEKLSSVRCKTWKALSINNIILANSYFYLSSYYLFTSK